MGEVTGISWTDSTFNPWVGCQRVSPGCEHCYAEALDKRVGGAVVDGTKQLRWGPNAPRVRTSAALWRNPIKWNRKAEAAGKRHRVFCASMADVFDAKVSDVWRVELFDLIRRTPAIDWQLLTKRPENIRPMLSAMIDAYVRAADATLETADMLQAWVDGKPPANVWLGTTVEDQQRANERIPHLTTVPAVVHFLSCEPLLERVRLPLCAYHVDWVIVGGESGGGARRFDVEWARSIKRDIARAMPLKSRPVALFVKQLGAVVVDRNDAGFEAENETWAEGPHEGLATHPDAWPTPRRIEDNIDGYRDEYQGAPVRVHLRDRAGGDMAEWPADLRVRQFPEVRHG